MLLGQAELLRMTVTVPLPAASAWRSSDQMPWAWLLALMATRSFWPARISAAVGKPSTGTSIGWPGTTGWMDAWVNGCQGWIITPLTWRERLVSTARKAADCRPLVSGLTVPADGSTTSTRTDSAACVLEARIHTSAWMGPLRYRSLARGAVS